MTAAHRNPWAIRGRSHAYPGGRKLAIAPRMRFSRPRLFYGLVRMARAILPMAAVFAVGCAHRGYTPIGAGQVTSSGHAASAAPGAGGAALAPTVAVPGDLPQADLRV